MLYSAEEMNGTLKPAGAKAVSATDSCAAVGALSLHWKLNTLGWLRSVSAEVGAVDW